MNDTTKPVPDLKDYADERLLLAHHMATMPDRFTAPDKTFAWLQEAIRLLWKLIDQQYAVSSMELDQKARCEALASLLHILWAEWVQEHFGVGGTYSSDGQSWCIGTWAVSEWLLLGEIPYKRLPEKEKAQRREWADRVIKVFERYDPSEP